VVSTHADPRYQRLVDGLVLPAPIAGDPTLDFCNTRAGWNAAEPREYLATYDHVVAWARAAELITAAEATTLRRRAQRDPVTAESVRERILALRDAVYAACTDSCAGDAWAVVAAEARAAGAVAVLVPDKPLRRRWLIPDAAGLAQPVLALAWHAASFLDSAELSRVGRCPGTDCGWLFLDPRGRRRWCTMAVCGNRAKARRHARRVRS
jgi:predicted RNA-binding Zn ribbon-like protein